MGYKSNKFSSKKSCTNEKVKKGITYVNQDSFVFVKSCFLPIVLLQNFDSNDEVVWHVIARKQR